MEVKSFFKELFDYGFHYDGRIAALMIANADLVSSESGRLFSHMINAHNIWNVRILEKENAFGVWEIHESSDYEQLLRTNYDDSLFILENYSLEERIHFVDTVGGSYERGRRDILFHIINHSTYHRGQLAKDFRKVGIPPISTDFVHYVS